MAVTKLDLLRTFDQMGAKALSSRRSPTARAWPIQRSTVTLASRLAALGVATAEGMQVDPILQKGEQAKLPAKEGTQASAAWFIPHD